MTFTRLLSALFNKSRPACRRARAAVRRTRLALESLEDRLAPDATLFGATIGAIPESADPAVAPSVAAGTIATVTIPAVSVTPGFFVPVQQAPGGGVSVPAVQTEALTLSVSNPGESVAYSAASSEGSITVFQPSISATQPTVSITQPTVSITQPTVSVAPPTLTPETIVIEEGPVNGSVTVPVPGATPPGVDAPPPAVSAPPPSVDAPPPSVNETPPAVSAPTPDVTATVTVGNTSETL